MRILTHNMLMCNVKKCSMQGYPLKIVPQNVETVESDFNPEFMQHMLPKLNWEGILSAANDLNIPGLPASVPSDAHGNMEFLQALHNLLMAVRVIDAQLVCNHCGRTYPIRDGIPNMLLNEDEV